MHGSSLPRPSGTGPLADQVVNWLLVLRADRVTEDDRLAFMAWRRADARHEQAWQQLSTALGHSLGRLKDNYNYPVPLVAPRTHEGGASRLRQRRRFLAGTLAVAGAAAGTLVVADARYPLAGSWADEATATGERRHVSLPDGSRMLLDARSRVDIKQTATSRDIYLMAGAVAVHAAFDERRPFLVHTAQGVVRTPGTRFMVRQDIGRTLAVAQQNEVEIVTDGGVSRLLHAGTGAWFVTTRIGPPRRDLLQSAQWQSGIIEVTERPLSHVIASLRPYHGGIIRVSAAAGGLIVTGRYTLDHVQGTLAALQAQLPIRITQFTPWITSVEMLRA